MLEKLIKMTEFYKKIEKENKELREKIKAYESKLDEIMETTKRKITIWQQAKTKARKIIRLLKSENKVTEIKALCNEIIKGE